MSFQAAIASPKPRSADESPVVRRALAQWPRLDRRALRRCGGDPRRIAAVVALRTRLPQGIVLQMLGVAPVSREEDETWFG